MRISFWRVMLALLIACPLTAAQAQQSKPAKQWRTTTPRSVGLNPAVLDSIDAEIREGRYGYVDRFLVVREGRIAYDRRYKHDYDRIYGDSARAAGILRHRDPTGPFNYYHTWWHPYYRRGHLHTLQSVTKTITSIIVGTAVTRGEFPSIDTPILAFLDTTRIANLDDRKRRITIRHLMTMAAGIEWVQATSTDSLESSYDWVSFTINRPMSEEPGTRYNYNDGAAALLAHVFYRATGVDIEEYAARHLFAPLGIREWYWKRAPNGLVDTEGGLYLSAEDVAKLWQLFLRYGVWERRQIVSREWVRESLSGGMLVTRFSEGPLKGTVYRGLAWSRVPDQTDTTSFFAGHNGYGGQHAYLSLKDDLIIIVNSWNVDTPRNRRLPFNETFTRVQRGITHPRR